VDINALFSRDGDRAGSVWMFELSVAPFCSRQIPTIFFQEA